jgi:glycosyltransferase involved in cell wall biosynthesis
MSREPRVSVIIPTFNRARWLPSAIRSVLDQTFGDFSLLVADNASTDRTPEVVRSFDDPRLRYLRRDHNVGLVPNHNLSLRDVEAEYCLILPDDDLIHPTTLEETVRALDENPRAGMAHGRFDLIGPDGEILLEENDWTYGLSADTVESGPEFIGESMRWSCRVCASTALMRTDALPNGFFDAEDFPAVDLGMWLRMAIDWEMAFLTRVLSSYRIHGDSHSAAFGPPEGPGYVQNTEIVTRLKEMKLRFIDLHEDRLDDPPGLRTLASRAMRRELVVMTRNLTLPERRFGQTARLLWQSAGKDPQVPLQKEAWLLLIASMLGPNMTRRLQRLRGRDPNTAPAG